MQMALFLGSLYRSFSLFPSGHLVLPFSLFCCVAPSYIKQTVSLAALGDIALIFQHWGTGVMQCAAMDTLHENLSLLKWAKSGRASLSDTGIYLCRSFLFSVLYYSLTKTKPFPSSRLTHGSVTSACVVMCNVGACYRCHATREDPVYVGLKSKYSPVAQQRGQPCIVMLLELKGSAKPTSFASQLKTADSPRRLTAAPALVCATVVISN